MADFELSGVTGNRKADDAVNIFRRQCEDKKRLKTYVEEVLKKSMATGVSKIVETKHPLRRIFKISVLLICLAGCLYQSVELLLQFLKHPTIMDIDIIKVDKVVMPAVTMCETPQILTGHFCSRYSNYCEPLNWESYCKGRERMCTRLKFHIGSLRAPKKKYLHLKMKEMLTNFTDILKDESPGQALNSESSRWQTSGIVIRNYRAERFERQMMLFNDEPFKCYAWNLRVNSSSNPITLDFSRSSKKQMGIDVYYPIYSAEYQMRQQKAHSFLLLHSPFTFENPTKVGYKLESEHWYTVNVNLEERHMLPAPYASNCIDYEKYWEEDKTLPRSREMCVEKCEMDNFMLACNCTQPLSLYPNDSPICGTRHEECTRKLNEAFGSKVKQCETNCRVECKKTNYIFTVKDETTLMGTRANRFYSGAQIQIKIENEVKLFRQRPKYEFIDLFGIMGGLVGIWLGAALVSFADFLESVIMIAVFYCRRRKKRMLAQKKP